MAFRWVPTKVGPTKANSDPESAQKRIERSEFGFTETLSVATILAAQAISLDSLETDKNCRQG